MKRRTSFVAVLLALAVALAPFAGNGSGHAGVAPDAAVTPTPLAMPSPQWPSPCLPGVTCKTPHWFYLVNGASEPTAQPTASSSGSPTATATPQALVLTVTTPPQASQHNGSPGGQPAVVVGISGSGLTLQPMSASTPALDNQMWYASEVTAGTPNPSYIISSLPPDWLPVTGATTGYSISKQLALGYLDSSGNNATISSASSANVTFNGIGLADTSSGTNTLGTITLTGATNPFQAGQTVGIAGTGDSGIANGIWTVQKVSGQTVTYTIPYQSSQTPYSGATGGNVVSMAGVYLNQQNAGWFNPTYGNLFQQWTYDSTDRTICNQRNFCLNSIDVTPSSGSRVTASVKPSTPVPLNYQWYFYPDRSVEQIIAQSTAPFPQLSTANQIKAQQKIAAKLGLSPSSCTYSYTTGGTTTSYTYYGLRCQYSNLAAPLSSYQALLSVMKCPPPVTPANWKKVKKQLLLELTDAIAVQNLFAQFQTVFEQSFLETGFLLDQDLADLEMDLTNESDQYHFNWETFVEGLCYTVLNAVGAAFGDPKVGSQLKKGLNIILPIAGNVMEGQMDTWNASGDQSTLPLANAFAGTAADLYAYIIEYFNHLDQLIDSGEETVLQDWGKMHLVGQLAQQKPSLANGEVGAYWDPSANSLLVKEFTDAYQSKIMEQILPQFFTLDIGMDSVGGGPGNGANTLDSGTEGVLDADGAHGVPPTLTSPALNQFATPKDPQGSQYGMWDTGWLYLGTNPKSGSSLSDTFLTQELAADVAQANPYLLYNGLGSWTGFGMNIDNLNCDGAITTITNFTPKALTVTIGSSKNTAIAGGYGTNYGNDLHGDGGSFSDIDNQYGIAGPVFRTLPPYGTTQFASSTIQGTGSAETQELYVELWDYQYSTSDSVATFNIWNYGCASSSSQVKGISGVAGYDGYNVHGDNFNNSNSTAGGNAVAIYGGK